LFYIGLESLIRTKRASGRPKDLDDLDSGLWQIFLRADGAADVGGYDLAWACLA
jgi:hypothetical protein